MTIGRWLRSSSRLANGSSTNPGSSSKACEAPKLHSGSKQKKAGQLGKSPGVEFVVRLWNLRFDTHCEEINSSNPNPEQG
ncbi:hypothetical protein VTI74DRAFT_897 [Chaetomium olivicolor]